MSEILEYFYSDFYIMIGTWSIMLSSFIFRREQRNSDS